MAISLLILLSLYFSVGAELQLRNLAPSVIRLDSKIMKVSTTSTLFALVLSAAGEPLYIPGARLILIA